MVHCDYFSASDDETAVGVLDMPGGPYGSAFDVVPLKGVDPVVTMAELEAVLTGCTYDEASERPRSGQLLSSPESESAFIVCVSDTLQEALASTTHPALAQVAEQWTETAELWRDSITTEIATEVLELLVGLASRARPSGCRLYCWYAL
jgi:hypothetical protein